MLRYISNELAEDIVYPGSTRNTPLKPNARAGSDASGINVYMMNKVLRRAAVLRVMLQRVCFNVYLMNKVLRLTARGRMEITEQRFQRLPDE